MKLHLLPDNVSLILESLRLNVSHKPNPDANYSLEKLRGCFNLPKERTERAIWEEANKMCEESLPPEYFDKWIEVMSMLKATRKALKD